ETGPYMGGTFMRPSWSPPRADHGGIGATTADGRIAMRPYEVSPEPTTDQRLTTNDPPGVTATG
ncbi:MAG TPA: hypothetical protein PK819_10625, partial [Thermomicrobiales bacterium]|nr:hypothetical protein [Thermomicrobiales bacterium]